MTEIVDGVERCDWSGWAKTNTAEYRRYHDEEWGRPVRDGLALWQKLVLDGMQAGLSWSVILNKRDTIYAAFDGLNPEVCAGYGASEIEDLLGNPGIIRSRLKCESVIKNARAYLAMESEGEDAFSKFIWSFTGGEQVVNSWGSLAEVPTQTEASRAMSKALKKRGFTFVGPVICYAFMQAVGIVNDHEMECWVREECIERQ